MEEAETKKRLRNSTDDELVMRIKQGDLEAKNQLWESVRPTFVWLVDRIKKRYPNLEKADLQQEIYLMFENCTKYFVPSSGTFRMYFRQTVINNATRLYLKNKTVRIPQTLLAYYFAERAGKDIPNTVETLKKLVNAKRVSEIEEKPCHWETPDKIAKVHETQEIVQKMIGFLPLRYRSFLVRYYGIGMFPMTYEQIAEQDGITRQRVEQIKKAALMKMQQVFLHFYKETDI